MIQYHEWSSLRNGGDKILDKIAKRLLPKTILEIGTFQGDATRILSKYCKTIHTIDIKDYTNGSLRDINNVQRYIVQSNQDKYRLIETIDFDFAFIDGDHQEGVLPDFEACKKCGRLLFHDYGNDHFYIDQIISNLPLGEIEVFDIFALWISSQHK